MLGGWLHVPPQSECQRVHGWAAGIQIESGESDDDTKSEARGRAAAASCLQRDLFGTRSPRARLGRTLGCSSGTARGRHDASCQSVAYSWCLQTRFAKILLGQGASFFVCTALWACVQQYTAHVCVYYLVYTLSILTIRVI